MFTHSPTHSGSTPVASSVTTQVHDLFHPKVEGYLDSARKLVQHIQPKPSTDGAFLSLFKTAGIVGMLERVTKTRAGKKIAGGVLLATTLYSAGRAYANNRPIHAEVAARVNLQEKLLQAIQNASGRKTSASPHSTTTSRSLDASSSSAVESATRNYMAELKRLSAGKGEKFFLEVLKQGIEEVQNLNRASSSSSSATSAASTTLISKEQNVNQEIEHLLRNVFAKELAHLAATALLSSTHLETITTSTLNDKAVEIAKKAYQTKRPTSAQISFVKNEIRVMLSANPDFITAHRRKMEDLKSEIQNLRDLKKHISTALNPESDKTLANLAETVKTAERSALQKISQYEDSAILVLGENPRNPGKPQYLVFRTPMEPGSHSVAPKFTSAINLSSADTKATLKKALTTLANKTNDLRDMRKMFQTVSKKLQEATAASAVAAGTAATTPLALSPHQMLVQLATEKEEGAGDSKGAGFFHKQFLDFTTSPFLRPFSSLAIFDKSALVTELTEGITITPKHKMEESVTADTTDTTDAASGKRLVSLEYFTTLYSVMKEALEGTDQEAYTRALSFRSPTDTADSNALSYTIYEKSTGEGDGSSWVDGAATLAELNVSDRSGASLTNISYVLAAANTRHEFFSRSLALRNAATSGPMEIEEGATAAVAAGTNGDLVTAE